MLPNKQKIQVTSQGILPLSPLLSTRATKAMILPGLKSASLISIRQLYDDNCAVLLNKTKLIAVKNKQIILQGSRNFTDGLWDIPVFKQSITKENFKIPQNHAAIYPAKPQENALHTTTTYLKKKRKSSTHLKVPRYFRYFDQLLEDNIDFISIEKQMNKDKQAFRPITLQSPSMSVIIQ
jgi:hypothetical protein